MGEMELLSAATGVLVLCENDSTVSVPRRDTDSSCALRPVCNCIPTKLARKISQQGGCFIFIGVYNTWIFHTPVFLKADANICV